MTSSTTRRLVVPTGAPSLNAFSSSTVVAAVIGVSATATMACWTS
jgi:hypothetical protein